MRFVPVVLVAVAGLAVLYVAALVGAALGSGLSWREMDFDRDGTTSPSELLAAADVGRRPVRVGDRACMEFFLLKDATTVKVVCPAA
jgi:hypothetical protein